jgi:IS5 family transposase
VAGTAGRLPALAHHLGLFQRRNAWGATIALHDALRAAVRLAAGSTVEPTAAVIDSQSVRAAPTVPRSSRGWDNAKKVNGRKRHLAVDTSGLLLEVLATPASVQDRDAARPLLFNLHRARRRVRRAWADGAAVMAQNWLVGARRVRPGLYRVADATQP